MTLPDSTPADPEAWSDLQEFSRRRRLFAVARLGALDRLGDPVLASLTRLAASVTGASGAAVHLFDESHQRRIAGAGVPLLDYPAEDTFCQFVVQSGDAIITPDASREPMFDFSPFTKGPDPVRFYAGLPLKVGGQTTVGTLCAFDTVQIDLTEDQVKNLEDIADLVRAHLELVQIANDLGREATEDGLTGVSTRVYFDGLVGRALAEFDRGGDDVLVAVIDVDHFKLINDTHGHDRGDSALRWIASRLADTLGPDVAIGRLGGDEFGVMARVAESETDEIMAKINQAPDGFTPKFRISVGSASAEPKDDVSSLLRRADKRMYAVKQAHRLDDAA